MKLFKMIAVLAFSLACTAETMAREGKFHVGVFRSNLYVDFLTSPETNTDSQILSGNGIRAGYVFSNSVALSTSLYSYAGCDKHEGFLCSALQPIRGASADWILGFNLLENGVYGFTGGRYFFEWNDDFNNRMPVMLLGMGFRHNSASIEFSTELRDDQDYFPEFIDQDALGSVEYFDHASSSPVYFTFSYLF